MKARVCAGKQLIELSNASNSWQEPLPLGRRKLLPWRAVPVVSPSFPGKAPVAPGDPGVQPGTGPPRLCVGGGDRGQSLMSTAPAVDKQPAPGGGQTDPLFMLGRLRTPLATPQQHPHRSRSVAQNTPFSPVFVGATGVPARGQTCMGCRCPIWGAKGGFSHPDVRSGVLLSPSIVALRGLWHRAEGLVGDCARCW